MRVWVQHDVKLTFVAYAIFYASQVGYKDMVSIQFPKLHFSSIGTYQTPNARQPLKDS